MDRIESLGNTLSQITLYDIKSMYNQAKNVVMNVTEMEAKVKEATNDEPWGASSSLMQDIAQGTFNFQHFNEIMPCIYARFMEKEARQWRQIYKSLQLLEYLIKHGSERVVDDARSHISTIKMLRNFHYIDDKGKDEGINVRNRSRELVELLADIEKIRTERRKAKANKHKYTGTGNDGMGMSFGGGRYGGFGNDSLGGGGGYSGNGGGSYDRDFGGYSGSGGFRDDTRRGGFEEYNAGDDEIPPRRSESLRSPTRSSTAPPHTSVKEPVAAAPVKEVDLLGVLDDDFGGTSSLVTEKALPAVNATASLDDDEFAEFQTANPVNPKGTVYFSPPAPVIPSVAQQPSYIQPIIQTQPTTIGISNSFGTVGNRQPAGPGASHTQFSNISIKPTAPSLIPTAPTPQNVTQIPTTTTVKPTANFDDLWSLSLGASTARPSSVGAGGKSIKDLEKEKANVGLWGNSGPGAKPPTLFGELGGVSMGSGLGGATSSSNNDTDDLLL